MIDLAYRTIQSRLNKNHYGTITPERINEFLNLALLNVYNDMFSKFRSALNKFRSNRGGLEFVDIQEDVDFFTTPVVISSFTTGKASLPVDKNNIISVWYTHPTEGMVEVSYVSNSELGYLSGLAAASSVFPTYSITGGSVVVNPADLSEITVYYVRKPAIPKWTYTSISNVPVFNPSAGDYQDLDMPEDWFDEVVTKATYYASEHLREQITMQSSDNENTKEYQKDTL